MSLPTDADGNQIHPTAVIEGDVRLGRRNKILAYTVLTGPLTIGDDNLIGPHVVIGSPGEDTRDPLHDSSAAPIRIGSRNIIREHTAVQKPCYGSITCLADDIFLMHGVHVPHDAVLENKVIAAPLAVIGGIAKILEGANLGIGCAVHQHAVVGSYSIVAMKAPLLHNLKPFSRYIPGKPLSVNHYALKKFGFEAYSDEISAYVLDGKRVTAERVLALVERYERYHRESGRAQY